ncbi:MAG TPA: hypothetical protein PLI09_06430 [Candidatus Hydrogenedentes bacterium]|nr:hypothetical protein [Candidatus Hydrogenedentota bacterium]
MKTTSQSQGSDTIIASIHKTRERMADACKGDIRAISAAARSRQQKSGRVTVSYANEIDKTPTESK